MTLYVDCRIGQEVARVEDVNVVINTDRKVDPRGEMFNFTYIGL